MSWERRYFFYKKKSKQRKRVKGRWRRLRCGEQTVIENKGREKERHGQEEARKKKGERVENKR